MKLHGTRTSRRAGGGWVLAAAGVAALPAQAASTATVTVVHGIPETPVDVYVDGKRALSDFTFKTVTDPIELPAGSHDIEVRPAGAASGSKPILELSPDLPAGANATVVAYLTAAASRPSSPSSTHQRRPGRDGSSGRAPHGRRPGRGRPGRCTPVITKLTNPNEKMLMVPAGTVSASVAAAGTTDPVIGPVDLPVESGKTLVVYAIGSLEGNTLTAVTQSYASGAGATPNAVNAGTGGQAADGGYAPAFLVFDRCGRRGPGRGRVPSPGDRTRHALTDSARDQSRLRRGTA